MATWWSFGPFEFDARQYRLVRDGAAVPIQPKPLDLLARLLVAPGALVTREDLEQVLYPGTTVTSHALRNVILKLREALGPDHEGWVETVPRRGVRFVGPVTRDRASPEGALPAERDTFVGRAADGEALERALGEARLVSLLGPGGVGKTRLAVHGAWMGLHRWSGGVWFCDLSAARTVDAVVSAVARGLDVPLGRSDPLVQLGHVLATRGRCLLVLDNFEQLVPFAQVIVGGWLDRAPELRILVTSREALKLAGERALDLGPLEGPDAAALFVDRARAADPGFPDRPDPGEVDALVRMLDALPLAIELAAARMRVMSLSALAERMGERFELLKSSGGRVARHATLRATLDGSWELLSEEERVALGALSVFDGGFVLAAAESVLDAGRAWPVDVVQGLVDKSLVRVVSDGRTKRFDLLVSVRVYAAERLVERDGAASAEQRHGAYFAAFGLDGLASLDPRAALEPELENLTVACRRAAARGDLPCAVATLRAAWAVLDQRGPFAAGTELAAAVAERMAPGEDAHVHWVLGMAAMSRGRMTEAQERLEAALACAVASSDPGLAGRVRVGIGRILMSSGRLAEARRETEAALAELQAGSSTRPGEAVVQLGNLCRLMGRTEEARAHYEDALRMARAAGDLRIENYALGNLAVVLHHGLGRLADAHVQYEAALAVARLRGDRRHEGHLLGNLGALHHDEGRLVEAGACYEAALAIHRHLGNRQEEGGVLGNLANWCCDRELWDEAHGHYERALAIHREVGNRREEGVALGNIASMWWARGDGARAEAYCEAALVIHREVHNRRFEGHAHDLLAALSLAVDPERSRRALDAALALHREVGNVVSQAKTLGQIGRTELVLGDRAAAAAAVSEAVSLLRGIGDQRTLGELLAVAAEVDRASG